VEFPSGIVLNPLSALAGEALPGMVVDGKLPLRHQLMGTDVLAKLLLGTLSPALVRLRGQLRKDGAKS
jgi:hypothetical protein